MASKKEPELKSEEDGQLQGRRYNCTRLFIRLLLSPNNGWRRLKVDDVDPADFERQLFYPLLALTALFQFFILFYDPRVPIADILRSAIVGFVSMFGAYFATLAACSTLMPPKASEKAKRPFFRVFVSASLSVFDIGYLISLVAPQLAIVLWLGIIYTLYIVCRGIKYLHLPHNERAAASVVGCILIVGLPTAIFALFTFLMSDA